MNEDKEFFITDTAKKLQSDISFFSEDKDRGPIFGFFEMRIRALLKKLSPENQEKFMNLDHDNIGCIILSAVDEGVLS